MPLIGYARGSIDAPTLVLQREALDAAGCCCIYSDFEDNGVARKRLGLDQALSDLKRGDVLVVWKLDRLGRSLSHLMQIIRDLGEREIGFQSLTEKIDTTTPTGTSIFRIIGALAEFERALLSERTRAGMTAAKKRGDPIGRPPAMTGMQIKHAHQLLDEGKTWKEVAQIVGVARSTLYRTLGKAKA